MPANSTAPSAARVGCAPQGLDVGPGAPGPQLPSHMPWGSGKRVLPSLVRAFSAWDSLGLIHSAGAWPDPQGSDPAGPVRAQ